MSKIKKFSWTIWLLTSWPPNTLVCISNSRNILLYNQSTIVVYIWILSIYIQIPIFHIQMGYSSFMSSLSNAHYSTFLSQYRIQFRGKYYI